MTAISLAFMLSTPDVLAQRKDWEASILNGITAYNAWKDTEAAKFFESALKLAEHENSAEDIAMCCLWKGRLCLRQGLLSDAERWLRRSLDLREAKLGTAHPRVADCLCDLADMYLRQGRLTEAELFYRRCVEIYKKSTGPDHKFYAEAIDRLACFYGSQMRFADAEPLHKLSLELAESIHGKEHLDVAVMLGHLAGLYRILGRYGEAEPLYKRSLEIQEAKLGKDHLHVASTMLSLGWLKESEGEYLEAERLYKRVVEIRETKLGKDNPDIATVLSSLGGLYKLQGRYAEAEPLYKRSLEIQEAKLGKDHLHVASTMLSLGWLKESEGEYLEAERLYKRVVEIRETKLGKDNPDIATALSSLGGLYKLQARYAEAEPLQKQSLKIRETKLGPDHPDVATSLSNLALLYQAQDRYAEAEPLYKQSLKITETRQGPDHPHVATFLNNLALLYQDQGRYAEAEPLYKRSLEIQVAKLGKDHLHVASTMLSLGWLKESEGEYLEAERLYKRVVEIRETKLGKDNPYIATALSSLGWLYKLQARYAEAEPLQKQSLKIRETKLGPDHPAVATSLNNLALLYQAQGRYAEAEPLHKRSLEIRETKLGKDHSDFATSLNCLGELYELQGRNAEAEPLYKRSLEIREAKLGKDHPSVAISLDNLADLCKSQGRYVEADPLYKRSLEIREAKLGKDHPDVAMSLNSLGDLYELQGRNAEAEQMFKRSLEIRETKLGKDHPSVASSLNNLAYLFASMERFAEAAPLYRRSLEIREAKLGKDHPFVATPMRNLATLLQAQERYADAEPLYRQSQKIKGIYREINAFQRLAQKQRFLGTVRQPSLQTMQQDTLHTLAIEHGLQVVQKPQEDSQEFAMTNLEKRLLASKNELGADSPIVAESLMQIGIAARAVGGSAKDEANKALPHLKKFAGYLLSKSNIEYTRTGKTASVLEKAKKYLGGSDASLKFASDSLICLGNLLAANSELAKACQAFELSKECCLARSEASPQDTVGRLIDLSTCWRLLSRHVQAAEVIEQAWKMAKKNESDIHVADNLKYKCKLALSRLNLDQGDLTAAHDAAKEALDIASKGTDISKVELASCYQLLAECSVELGKNDDAIRYAQAALDIPDISKDMKTSCLALLGGALLERGDTKEAILKLSEALDMSGDKDNTLDQSLFASASALLGYAQLKEGNLGEARRRFDWAHSWDKLDPSADGALATARDFSGLAQVEESAGDQTLSLRYSLQAADKVNRYVEDVFPQLSFGEQCAFLAIAKRQRDMLLSVCQDADSIGPAYRFMLKWKGLLLESLRTEGAINAAANRNTDLLALTEELSAVRRQLAGLANKDKADLAKDTEADQRSRTLTERKEKLEVELATKSGVSLKDPIQGGADWLREQLHDDEAFIDILPYKPFNANNERYAAVVMKKGKGGEPRFFDLGNTAEMDKPAIDKLISEWRFAVTGDKFEKTRDSKTEEDEAEKKAVRVKAKEREELTASVAALLVNSPKILSFINSSVAPARKVWLCPEAAFARVPWNAIATISSATPISICEVDSPREFVVLRSEKEKVASGKRSIMLAGLKDFKKAKLKDLDGALAEIIALNDEAKDRGIERKYLPEENATKDAVKENLELVTLAHIATHGFAAGRAAGSDSDRGSRSATSGLRAGGIRSAEGVSLLSTARSPLVECGLYFAFPEEITSSKDELPNVMTAEEMIGLNLKNCELVTLSACQTGLGRRMNGQGIIGLRSAIMGAGARSILMSLWSVDDDATRELMKRFYGYIWDEKEPLSKVEALKKAQDEIRAVPKWKDPKFWAGWVLSGDGWR